ncbi:potassium channel, sub T, member 2 [Mortierella sp. GBA30]|nr:potassium channel, sub T, member 2 [Mortierella sp. GBA30]
MRTADPSSSAAGLSRPPARSSQQSFPPPTEPYTHAGAQPIPPPPTRPIPWSRASTQFSRLGSREPGSDSRLDSTVQGSTLTWTQRLNNITNNRTQSQGFIWDSLDNSMDEVQEARRSRKNGPIRLLTSRKDTSYNSIRSTFRLQYAEKRKSDLRNIVSSIRLGLDYDVYKAKAMALLKSKARTIFFIMMDLVVDALFCVLYLAEAQYLVDKDSTPYPNPSWLFVPRPKAIWIIAVAMSSWNLMSALIRFIFADNKWRFIFSIQTLLDTVTAIPFILSGAFLPNGQWLYVPYFLRSWSVISRLQRALSIGVDIGISDQPFDPVKAKLIALVAYFVTILYNGMAAFLYCETMFAPKTEKPHTVWDAFYFILITASTVGYGDITPKSLESRIVVMVFIIVALSVVPGLIAGTIETLKSSRSGGGSYIQSRGANGVARQYLVMIGDFQSAKRVADMLIGFFNKEFSDSDVRIVFLSRNKPSKDVKTLLDMPMHKNRTTMLVGNGLDEVDLKRCQARDAGGVFIIPDQTTSGLESQDTMTTLLAWSLHIYAPNTRVFTYNLLPETESFQWGIVEQSMCISDVKQLLLAYNCRHRGTATLILNLLHPSEPANSYDDGWQAQYGDGTGNELYVDSVPELFIGWTFAQAAWFIFQEFQSILIGVDIFLKADRNVSSKANQTDEGPHSHHYHDPSNLRRAKSSTTSGTFGQDRSFFPSSSDGQYHLTLNPGNSYRLGRHDQLIYIAQSPSDVDAIGEMTVDQYERLLMDERGPLESSRVDFAKAMAMYHTLRESRADARAAARRRAEHRRGKKSRAQQHHKSAQSMMTTTVKAGPGYETSSPENMGMIKEFTPPSRAASSKSHRSKKTTGTKMSRPAWNVALYDDDDDDEDDYDHDNDDDFYFNDDRNDLNRVMSQVQSPISRMSRQGESGSQGRDQTRVSKDMETIPLSEPRFWSKPGNDSSLQHSTVTSATAAAAGLDNSEFYPSNYDRNAAAAAAADAVTAQRKNSRHPTRKPSSVDVAVDPETEKKRGGLPAAGSSISRAVVKQEKEEQDGKVNQEGQEDASAAPESCRPRLTVVPDRVYRGSFVQESFQVLDSTFIGQTSVTRSETKDLPLCHLLIHPPETIKPLIRDDLSSLKDHIVVCANAGENLYRFLATLRPAQIKREDLKTIVVLTRNPLETFTSDSSILGDIGDNRDGSGLGPGPGIGMSDAAGADAGVDERYGAGNWDAILSFPRVYWVSGNCRHQRDLVRAGILGASSIVVMAHSVAGLDRDEFADSTAIMAHHMIYQTLQQRGLLGRQHIIVDISERSNIRFLNMRNLSMIGSNQEVIAKVSRIGTGSASSTAGGFWMTPIFASGQVLVSSLLDNVLFQAYSKTHILDLIKLCCGVRFKQAIELDQLLGIDSSNICLIETPAQFVGKSFLKLFQALALLYGIVPLGLYRAPDRELNNALPFVFSNPLPGILLKQTDMIYVLKS